MNLHCRHLIAPLCLLSISGCIGGTPYGQAFHTGYSAHRHTHRHTSAGDAILAFGFLVDALAAWQSRVEPAPPVHIDPAREAAVVAKMRQIRWAERPAAERELLLGRCAELHRRLTTAPGDHAACPTLACFQETCRDLSPEVVRCLDPGVRRREQAACSSAFASEDQRAADRMNAVLGRCWSRGSEPGQHSARL